MKCTDLLLCCVFITFMATRDVKALKCYVCENCPDDEDMLDLYQCDDESDSAAVPAKPAKPTTSRPLGGVGAGAGGELNVDDYDYEDGDDIAQRPVRTTTRRVTTVTPLRATSTTTPSSALQSNPVTVTANGAQTPAPPANGAHVVANASALSPPAGSGVNGTNAIGGINGTNAIGGINGTNAIGGGNKNTTIVNSTNTLDSSMESSSDSSMESSLEALAPLKPAGPGSTSNATARPPQTGPPVTGATTMRPALNLSSSEEESGAPLPAGNALASATTTAKPKEAEDSDYSDYSEEDERRSAQTLNLLRMKRQAPRQPACYMLHVKVNNSIVVKRGCTKMINANNYLTCQALHAGKPTEECQLCGTDGCNQYLMDYNDWNGGGNFGGASSGGGATHGSGSGGSGGGGGGGLGAGWSNATGNLTASLVLLLMGIIAVMAY